MPLPLFLGIAAAIAAAGGIGGTVAGGVKMKKANDRMKTADYLHNKNLKRLEKENKSTVSVMDNLGKRELEIMDSFNAFSDLIERIKNRPEFASYSVGDGTILQYKGEELKKASVAANVLLAGISGAAAGTLGGLAASGVATTAVMALGTASTGVAISSLSGAAATNATLAALGGGAIAAGGGGMALGSMILGASSLGVGLLVGGVIFSVTGRSLSKKADEAWGQMEKAQVKIDRICEYLALLNSYAKRYTTCLETVNSIYEKHVHALYVIIDVDGKDNWNDFTQEEKLITENTVLLVSLLHEMCKIEFVKKSNDENDLNKINSAKINQNITKANQFVEEKQLDKMDAVYSGLGDEGFEKYFDKEATFDVILQSYGDDKLAVMKVVHEATDLGLSEAKELVEGAPKAVKEGISKDEADKLAKALEAAGAEVKLEVKKSDADESNADH